MRRVSAKDVARHAGFSVPAVYQAVRGNGNLRPETRDRILGSVKQLGFRANAAARATREGKLNALALLTSNVAGRSYLPNRLLRGIREVANEHDQRLMLAELGDEKLTNAGFMPRILSEWSADGLLIDYHSDIPPRFRQLLRKFNLPAVWINIRETHDCVHPDDLAAGRLATQLLLDHGHRRIGYVNLGGQQRVHYSGTDRREGYRETMAAAGLSGCELSPAHDVAMSDRFVAARAWLAGPDRPTGIVAYTDTEALPVAAAAWSLGLSIPQNLSIVAVHDGPVDAMGLRMTTAKIDMYEVGRRAVAMLLQKLASDGAKLPSQTVSSVIREGVTVAPAA